MQFEDNFVFFFGYWQCDHSLIGQSNILGRGILPSHDSGAKCFLQNQVDLHTITQQNSFV